MKVFVCVFALLGVALAEPLYGGYGGGSYSGAQASSSAGSGGFGFGVSQPEHNIQARSPQDTEEQLESRYGQGSYRTLTKVVEQGNQLCFSAKPLPECNQGYRPENTAEKQMDFICVNDGQQARIWRDQARKGEHISALRRRNPNKTLTVELPTKCIAA